MGVIWSSLQIFCLPCCCPKSAIPSTAEAVLKGSPCPCCCCPHQEPPSPICPAPSQPNSHPTPEQESASSSGKDHLAITSSDSGTRGAHTINNTTDAGAMTSGTGGSLWTQGTAPPAAVPGGNGESTHNQHQQ
ncbi:unnamed protein product [Urochloa humidicola]